MSYLWSTGETTQTILTNGLTNYSVVITSPPPGNCSKTKSFVISYHAQPFISTIDIQGLNVTINTTQSGDFEYSIDGENFQDSNTFTVPEGGSYIGYVREKINVAKIRNTLLSFLTLTFLLQTEMALMIAGL